MLQLLRIFCCSGGKFRTTFLVNDWYVFAPVFREDTCCSFCVTCVAAEVNLEPPFLKKTYILSQQFSGQTALLHRKNMRYKACSCEVTSCLLRKLCEIAVFVFCYTASGSVWLQGKKLCFAAWKAALFCCRASGSVLLHGKRLCFATAQVTLFFA